MLITFGQPMAGTCDWLFFFLTGMSVGNFATMWVSVIYFSPALHEPDSPYVTR